MGGPEAAKLKTKILMPTDQTENVYAGIFSEDNWRNHKTFCWSLSLAMWV